jgi:hypothetical protein
LAGRSAGYRRAAVIAIKSCSDLAQNLLQSCIVRGQFPCFTGLVAVRQSRPLAALSGNGVKPMTNSALVNQ